jgi:hypothetical protein
MKQQFVITHQYTVLQQTEQLDQSLMDQQLSMLCFLKMLELAIFLWTQHFD